MKISKEHLEMTADKVRGYFFNSAEGLVAITFKGDWVMNQNGFLVRTSTEFWNIPAVSIETRSEELEQKIGNIIQFCNKDSLLGIKKATDGITMRIVHWFETEFEARTVADARDQKRIWDCKEKKYI